MDDTSTLFIEVASSEKQKVSDLLKQAGYCVKRISGDISLANSSEQTSAQKLTSDKNAEERQTQYIMVSPKSSHKESTHKGLLCLDNLQLNRLTQQVYVNDQEMNLTSIQYSLLRALLENQGVVMQKSALYQSILSRKLGPHDRSLDMHLSRLRRKLSALGWQGERLKTVHGKGYCLS